MATFYNRRQGFTLVELLVVIAIISILAGLVVPGLLNATGEAHKVQCASNLRGIHMAGSMFARRGNAFPIARGPHPEAHDSLNVLLESAFGADFEPRDFVCPAGEAVEAVSEEKALGSSSFRLSAANLSYAWVGQRTASNRKGFLCSDKYYEGYEDADGAHLGHRGVIMAIDTAGRVQEVHVARLAENGLLPGLVR